MGGQRILLYATLGGRPGLGDGGSSHGDGHLDPAANPHADCRVFARLDPDDSHADNHAHARGGRRKSYADGDALDITGLIALPLVPGRGVACSGDLLFGLELVAPRPSGPKLTASPPTSTVP